MTILLYKDGQLIVDNEQPLEGVSLDNLAALLADPHDGDVILYDESSGMWLPGKVDALPPVSSSDNGKVLTVADGAWAAADNLFLVTVENNTADKTFADTLSAINAGKAVILSRSNITYNFIYCDSSTIVFARANKVGNNNIYEEVKFNSNGTVGTSQRYYLPSVGGANDKGKELVVASTGVWTAQAKKFLVTLTPTALDYSGTMDKTVAEINAAYEAGMEIVFRVMTSATSHMDVACTATWNNGSNTYPSYNGFILSSDNGGTLIFASTGTTNDGTKQTYSATVYSLTPAS